MREEIRVIVEMTFDMDAEATHDDQRAQIQNRIVDFLAEDSEAVSAEMIRFQPEHDTYSHPIRDAVGRPIRVDDVVFWNRQTIKVERLSAKRINGRIWPEHCVVIV